LYTKRNNGENIISRGVAAAEIENIGGKRCKAAENCFCVCLV